MRRIRANGALTHEIKNVHGTVHFVTWSDASWANRKDMTSTGGFLTGCCGDDVVSGQQGHISVISWGGNKLKRIARNSLAAELQALANAEDELHITRAAWAELQGETLDLDNPSETVARIPGIVAIDAKSIYDTLTSANQPLQLSEKRPALELMA